MHREYYNTSEQIYDLFIHHPVFSQLLTEFGIDENRTDPIHDPIRLRDVCDYLVANKDTFMNNELNIFYNDSPQLEELANKYGCDSTNYPPPYDQYVSPAGTKLTVLLNYTLYFYKFAVTDNFFEKNILNFLPTYDREQIEKNPKLYLTIKALGSKLDDLEDKISKMRDIYNIDKTSDEILDYLGQNIGYEREDVSLSGFSFRELLKNIIEIYKIKGTNYSFSFFFKFLGFEINLKEFYFNRYSENAEVFPGVDKNSVEYFLTTKNPLYDTSNGNPVDHLFQTRNLGDWKVEYDSLINKGCNNSSEYMRGLETYNNDGITWHSNPWTYFKTNLIEYELEPFFDKLNLTASDNETIRKYIRFLSPTYLFTWININLRPWIEDVNIVIDSGTEGWIVNINKVLGDLRPTPDPWPFEKKTDSDPGFEPPYKDYEELSDYIALYDPDGDVLTFDLQNNLNLRGIDTLGSVLMRNGMHVRQIGSIKHITDAKHDGTKRLVFDQLSIQLKTQSTNWTDYSDKSYPSTPINHRPLEGRTIKDNNIINFSWDDTEGAQKYRIQISNSLIFDNVLFDDDNLSTNSYTSPSTMTNDKYYWRIKVKNDSVYDPNNPEAQWTAWSDIWHFTLKNIIYPRDTEILSHDSYYIKSYYNWDTNYTHQIFDKVKFKLEWDRIANTKEYNVQLSANNNFTMILYDKIIENEFLEVELDNGVYYWRYRSKSISEQDFEAWSSIYSFEIDFPLVI